MEAAGMSGIRPQGSFRGPAQEEEEEGGEELCSPQEVLEWELAVDLQRLWVLTSPKPSGVMFVSTCSSVGLAGWDWKRQILNENTTKNNPK